MKRSSDKGPVGIIETLLVVIVICALGFLGYRTYQTRTAESGLATVKPDYTDLDGGSNEGYINYEHQRKTGSGYTLTSCNDGKRKYTSAFEGASFSFPCDWRIRVDDMSGDVKYPVSPKRVTIESPIGSTVAYEDLVGQTGHYGYNAVYKSVERITTSNSNRAIYLVQLEGERGFGLTGNSDSPTPRVGGSTGTTFLHVDSKVPLSSELRRLGVSDRNFSFGGEAEESEFGPLKEILRSFRYE